MAGGLASAWELSAPIFLALASLKMRSPDGPRQNFPMELAKSHMRTPVRKSCKSPSPLKTAGFHMKMGSLPMKSRRFHRKNASARSGGLQLKGTSHKIIGWDELQADRGA